MMVEIANEKVDQDHNFLKKSHYKVSEVLERFQIKPYLLRFWESEFEQLKPIVSDSGQKLYTPKDLFTIKHIKRLLLEDKLPIQKAKLQLSKQFQKEAAQAKKVVNKKEDQKDFQQTLFAESQQMKQILEIKKSLLKAQEKINDIKNERNWI